MPKKKGMKMITDNSAIGFSISQKDGDLILAIFPYDLPNDCGEDDFIHASLKEACLEEIDANKLIDGKIPKDGSLHLKNISDKFRLLAKIFDEEIEKNAEP